jgi:hypothetical protein
MYTSTLVSATPKPMSPLTSTHDTARHHARENQSSCPSNGSFVSLPITCSEHAGGPRTAMPCEHTRAHDGCVQEFTKLARRSRMIHTAIPHMPTLFTSHATSPTWESCLGTVRGACCWNFRVPTALATPRTMTGCNAIADPRAPSRCGKGGLACDARTCRIMRQTQAHWRILRSPEWRPRCCYQRLQDEARVVACTRSYAASGFGFTLERIRTFLRMQDQLVLKIFPQNMEMLAIS